MRDQTGNGSLTIRRSLGRKLKALRVESGKSSADVTEAQIASRSKLFKIEAGSVPVKMADVRAMCWLYGVDIEVTDQLAKMALNTASDGWWEDYADAVPRWFTTFIELEGTATRISQYQSELVPGLLQTAEYHRAVYDSDPLALAEQAGRQVALRTARQHAAFNRQSPLQMTAVLSEGALLREVGSPEIMEVQLRYLLTHQADVSVLPAKTGAHAAMKGPFVILDYHDDDPPVVYLLTLAGARDAGADATVSAYRRVFDSILSVAVPIKEWQS